MHYTTIQHAANKTKVKTSLKNDRPVCNVIKIHAHFRQWNTTYKFLVKIPELTERQNSELWKFEFMFWSFIFSWMLLNFRPKKNVSFPETLPTLHFLGPTLKYCLTSANFSSIFSVFWMIFILFLYKKKSKNFCLPTYETFLETRH